MIVIKKKNVLQELAFCLFLMLESEKGATTLAVITRIREKAQEAIKTAAIYTGIFGAKDLQEFLKSRHLKFTIDCGSDIVKGDIIRFVEGVFNNKRKPAQMIGKRGITAEVMGIHSTDSNPILEMRVITSGGTWELPPETAIIRPLKNVVHFEVMRVARENESQHQKYEPIGESPKTIRTAQNNQLLVNVLQTSGIQTSASRNAVPPKPETQRTGTSQTQGRYDILKPKKQET
jgi:hypothetical protein